MDTKFVGCIQPRGATLFQPRQTRRAVALALRMRSLGYNYRARRRQQSVGIRLALPKSGMEKKYTSLAENEAIYQEHTVTNAPLQQTAVIYHQPQPSAGRGRDPGETRHECQILAASADRMYALSICWCVVCCLCGSPLTLACFIPAIVLSVKVR